MKPHDEHFGKRAIGAAAALIVAGSVFSASIIFHSRTFSQAFDIIIPLIIGLVVGFGFFLRWRGFYVVACVFVSVATIVHIIAIVPRATSIDGLLPIVAPRLVLDVMILLLLVLPATRACYVAKEI